jgi:hypothetical protein
MQFKASAAAEAKENRRMTANTIASIGPRAVPPLTPASRPFWTGGADGRLRLLRNKASGRWVHPFDEIADGDPAFAPAILSGKGKIYTFTINRHAYNPAVAPPYVIALVILDEQEDLRIPTNIVNCVLDDLYIGMRVKAVFERQGDIFAPLFEPAG